MKIRFYFDSNLGHMEYEMGWDLPIPRIGDYISFGDIDAEWGCLDTKVVRVGICPSLNKANIFLHFDGDALVNEDDVRVWVRECFVFTDEAISSRKEI